jgi:copper chaperone
METKTVRTPNMSCGHCVATIERELTEVPGVVSVQADLDRGSVTIRWESPATWSQLAALLTEIGYPPEA